MCPFTNPAGPSLHPEAGRMGLISQSLADRQTEAREVKAYWKVASERSGLGSHPASLGLPSRQVIGLGDLCRGPQPWPSTGL